MTLNTGFSTRCLAAEEESFRVGGWNHGELQRSQLFRTPIYALVPYIIKSALIIYIKTLYSLIAPTCFDKCCHINTHIY
jgi:hypothetical protein